MTGNKGAFTLRPDEATLPHHALVVEHGELGNAPTGRAPTVPGMSGA